MKENKEKYLVITISDTIDARCSECSKAGINLHCYPTKSGVIRKLAEVSQYSNVKVKGIFKMIDKLTVDKDLNIELLEDS